MDIKKVFLSLKELVKKSLIAKIVLVIIVVLIGVLTYCSSRSYTYEIQNDNGVVVIRLENVKFSKGKVNELGYVPITIAGTLINKTNGTGSIEIHPSFVNERGEEVFGYGGHKVYRNIKPYESFKFSMVQDISIEDSETLVLESTKFYAVDQ